MEHHTDESQSAESETSLEAVSDGTDDGFKQRAIVGFSFIVMVLVMVPSGLFMALTALFEGPGGCLGYGPDCNERATEAMLVGWGILAVGFCVGFGIAFWRKQLRWTLLGLAFVPVALKVFDQWIDT